MDLVLIAVLIFLIGYLTYYQTGKKEFLRFDLIQFVYAFVLTPIAFILVKTIIFRLFMANGPTQSPLLKSHLNRFFILDSLYGVFFLFSFAGIVIHSFTKSLQLKKSRDPLFDVFHQTEFFHKWASHLILYVGLLVLFALPALLNTHFPLPENKLEPSPLLATVSGTIMGFVVFFSIERGIRFSLKMRLLMKIAYAFLFLAHALAYFLFSPSFDFSHLLFWFSLSLFSILVVCAYFLDRIPKFEHFFDRFRQPKD